MASLFDVKSGQPVEVPDDQVQQALASRQFSTAKGIEVPMTTDSGEVRYVQPEEVANALQTGMRLTNYKDTENQYQAQKAASDAEAYDGAGVALTAGLLRGATLGTSDAALRGLGLADAAQGVKEQNPISSTLGEVGGAVATSMYTGGLGTQGLAAQTLGTGSLAAKIAGSALAGGAEGIAQGAGTGLSEAMLGDPEDLAEKMVYGGAVGGLFGGLLGGLGTAAVDGGIPLAKKGYAAAKDATELAAATTTKHVGNVISKIVKDPESAAAFKQVMAEPETLKALANMDAKEVSRAVKTYVEEVDAFQKGVKQIPKDIKEALKSTTAKEQAVYEAAVGQSGGDFLGALDNVNQTKNQLYDKAYELIKSPEVTNTPASYIHNIVDKYEDTIRALEKTGEAAPKALAKEMSSVLKATLPDARALAQKGDERAAGLLLQFNQGSELEAARKLDDFLGRQVYNREFNLGGRQQKIVSDTHNFIKDTAYHGNPNQELGRMFVDADEFNGVYSKLNKAIKPSFEGVDGKTLKILAPEKLIQIDRLLSKAGDLAGDLKTWNQVPKELLEQGGQWKKANELLEKFKTLDPTARTDLSTIKEFADFVGNKDIDKLRKAQEFFEKNPEVTGTDKVIKFKQMMGEPVDADLKALASKERTLQQFKALKQGSSDKLRASDVIGASLIPGKIFLPFKAAMYARNNPLGVAQSFGRVANFAKMGTDKLEKAANYLIEGAVANKRTFERGATQAYLGAKREDIATTRKEMENRKLALQAYTSPTVASELMGKRFDLDNNPTLQTTLSMQAMRTAEFLNSKLPQNPNEGKGLFAGRKYEPSDYDLHKFNTYINAASDPMRVVDNIAKGSVSPEELETLSVIYPKMYKQLQDKVLAGIIDKGAEVPYNQRISLGLLFNVPADETLQPAFISEMQKSFVKVDQGGRPPSSAQNKVKFSKDIGESTQTSTDRVTQR